MVGKVLFYNCWIKSHEKSMKLVKRDSTIILITLLIFYNMATILLFPASTVERRICFIDLYEGKESFNRF